MKKIKTPFLRRQESTNTRSKDVDNSTLANEYKNCYLVIVLILLSLQGYTQGMMAPPSPNAQALARYAAVPVNYYTGIPSINIPLYTLPGKELSVPISLSYHAGGNKVQDVASWVGLGWSLNSGGVITRVVRGLPDEDPNGYCGVNNIGEKAKENLPAGSTSWEYLVNVANGTWDGEPDVFYFNFLGNAGRFVIDANGKAYTTPYKNVKISTGICNNGNTEWIITDESGTKYYFGTSSSHRETSSVEFSSTDGPSDSYSYTSSWYLSRIESVNSTDNIWFYYNSGGNITTTSKLYRKYDFLGGDVRVNCDKYNNETTETSTATFTTQSPKYISRISSNYGDIYYEMSDEARKDISGGKQLEKVIIKDKSSNVIDSYSLDFGYFKSDGCSQSECYRLKLESVRKNLQPMINISYNEVTNLPARYSDDFDHWGYYSNLGGRIPGVIFNGVVYTEFNGDIFYGVSKQTNPNLVGANLIESISYPTGQITTFDFEANQFYNSETGINNYAGGVRISKISVDPGNGLIPQETDYKYNDFSTPTRSSGLVYEIPKYWNMVTIQEYGDPTTGEMFSSHYIVRHSKSLNTLYDLSGVHLGYSNVSQKSSLNETKYSYHDLTEFADTKNQIRLFQGTNAVIDEPDNWEKAPEPKKNSGFWKRGQLKRKEILDAQMNLLSSEIYDYNFATSIKKQLTGVFTGPAGYLYKVEAGFPDCRTTTLVNMSYFETSQPFYLTKQTTEIYDQSNPAFKTTNVNEFVYNTQGQLSETKAYNLAQSSIKQINKIKYVNDPDYNWSATQQCEDQRDQCISTSSTIEQILGCFDSYDLCLDNLSIADSDAKAILDLRIKHATNVPIEQMNIIEEGGAQYLVGATYAKFKTQGANDQMVVPYKTYVMDKFVLNSDYSTSSINNSGNFIEPTITGGSYKLAGTFNFSTSTGQLTSQIVRDGTTTTNTYDPSGILTSISTGNGGLITTASQAVTPLVGVTQKTDANGRQVNYTYDKKGRLKYVKDHDGNVATRYRYNTVTPLTSAIEVSGSYLTGSQMDFSAFNPFDHGVSTITWGFADGTVAENSTESVSHIFSTAGSKTISFTVANPEYEIVSVTKTIRIFDPMASGSILSNGSALVAVNLCLEPNKTYSNLTAPVTDGCTNKTYVWSKKINTGSWSSVNPTIGFFVGVDGTYYVRCVITDGCGNTFTVDDSFSVTNDCDGAGGITPQ